MDLHIDILTCVLPRVHCMRSGSYCICGCTCTRESSMCRVGEYLDAVVPEQQGCMRLVCVCECASVRVLVCVFGFV